MPMGARVNRTQFDYKSLSLRAQVHNRQLEKWFKYYQKKSRAMLYSTVACDGGYIQHCSMLYSMLQNNQVNYKCGSGSGTVKLQKLVV